MTSDELPWSPWDSGWAINCKTAGEVISALQRLHPDERVTQGMPSRGVDVVLYNRSNPELRHVAFCEGGAWTDE